MTALLVTWVANSLAIYAVAYLMGGGGVHLASFRDAFIVGAVLSVINALVKPLLVVLTLPLTVLTLGLFYFVVSAFCLWIASELVPGFQVHGFWTTLFAAILISIFSSFFGRILGNAAGEQQWQRR